MIYSSRDGMLHMIFKQCIWTEPKWARLRGLNYLTKVMTGFKYRNGSEVEKVEQVAV